MVTLFISVRDKDAERARKLLLESESINNDILIEREGKKVLFPLKGSDPSNIGDEILALGDLSMRVGKARIRPPKSYKDIADVPQDLKGLLPSSFDMIGDVCILKLPHELSGYERHVATALTTVNRKIRKVALDRGVVGEYRLRDMDIIIGGPDLETVHIENNIRIKLDPSKVYFSPRLSTERLRLASLTGEERVLDMFCGVGPFALTIGRHSSALEIVGIDLNPDCIRYMEMNIALNSLEDRVSCYLGDAGEVAPTMGHFDRIVMNLPHSSLDHLDTALDCIGSGMIHLYFLSDTSGIPQKLGRIDAIMSDKGHSYSIEGLREVHQYSPDSYIMVLDLRVSG